MTREPFRNRGRITDLISSEQLFNDLGQPPLDIANDRIMMCGSDTRQPISSLSRKTCQ